MSADSDEQVKETIAALEKERRSQTADHAAIDAELKRLRGDSQPPQKRAQKRPRAKSQTR